MSLISKTLLKHSSISTHIQVLTNPKVVATIHKHIGSLTTYSANSKTEINNLLYTLNYLRESFEAETKGKALPTMAAKHKELVHTLLDRLFVDCPHSLQQGGEIYVFLTKYIRCLDQNDATLPQIETPKEG